MPHADNAGVRIAWESEGTGDPVLFLHGLGGSMHDWAAQLPAFAPKHRVIRLDVRGHGSSDKPGGRYEVEQFASDAIAVLRAAGVERAHIAGISMGGMIALQLAVDAPGLVRSLVLVNTGPEVKAENAAERFALWQRRFLTRFLSMEKFATILAGRLFPDPGQESMRAEFHRRWAANDPAAYRESYLALLRWSVADRIHMIREPALVIHAEKDYTTYERKERWAKKLPNARMVTIAGGRHAVSMDSADEFNRVVLEFLEQVGKK
jgi:pimeloyl-ACP methyl ester carboxylesterase